MYCKMCGSLLDDTDRFCKACGEKTDFHPSAESPESIERQKEEVVVFNPPFEDNIHHNRFYLVEDEPDAIQEENKEEDQEGFLSGDEIENQKKENLTSENPGRPDRADTGEFQWNVHDFPKSKKTEEAVFNWNPEEGSLLEQKEAMAAAFEEELFREIHDESNRIKESNIDRFFTFSRKNEEFQRLLDQEYEKLNRHSTDSVFSEDNTEKAEKSETDQDVVLENQVAEDHETEGQTDEQQTTKNQTPENSTAEKIMPETDKERDSEPIEDDKEVLEKDKNDEETDGNKEQPQSTPGVQAGHLDEMAKARAAFFGEDLIKDNESIIKKLEPEDSEDEEAVAVVVEAEVEPQTEADDDSEAIDKEEALTVAEAKSAIDEPETLSSAEEQSNNDGAGPPPYLYAGLLGLDDIPQEQFGTEDGGGNKKHRGAQITLIIIAIILAIEISILAIRYFAPESTATKVINDTQTRIINVVTGWFGINGNDSGNPSDEETNPGTEIEEPGENSPSGELGSNLSEPDPVPMADREALIATQLDKNANIQWVGNNDDLGFVEGKNYGLADLNNSKPIENNIWRQKEDEVVYYDQSVVGTIIAFDSQWIDYVNGGSKDVLNLLKKGSKAYENAVGFSKIGKVKENFKVLQIGEIRQGADGFYVWAHEEIQITEKGVTTDKSYNWIYYLEPIDGKLNIVNYFKFK